MSGRGDQEAGLSDSMKEPPFHCSLIPQLLPTVLHEPEDVQVALSLRTTTSAATFSLGNDPPATPFYIQVHASVKSSSRPTLPVTLATFLTPLERQQHQCTPASRSHAREEGGEEEEEEEEGSSNSPAWLNSALTPLRSTTHLSKYAAPPALGWIACRRGGYPRDLRASWDFITVPPAAGPGKQGEEKAEVVVRHLLPRDGLRFYRTDGAQGEVRPEEGEKFVVGPSAGGLGTFWWRWGDLEGDLAGKRFRADEWWDGDEDEDKDENEGGGGGGDWVKSEGENGFGLTMVVENEAEVEFV